MLDPTLRRWIVVLKRVFAVVIVMPVAAGSLVAQDMTPGMWRGTFRIERGRSVAVEFMAAAPGDSLPSFMRTATSDDTELFDLRAEKGELAFRWGEFSCQLAVKGANREGTCRAADGTSGRLSLAPPVPAPADGPDRRVDRSSDVVTNQELLATGALNLLDALRRIRPLWFRLRTPSSGELTGITVLTMGQPRGGIGVMSDMPLLGVREVRFYDASRAIIRFGKKYALGVIEITEGAAP